MRLEYVDARGNVLALTGNPLFKLTGADGLTTVSADLATSTVPGMDGDIVNSAQASPRSIVLDLSIENDVENASRAIRRIIKAKQNCTLRFYPGGDRNLRIGGVVEQIDMPRFANLAVMQVTIHCAQPWWEDQTETATDISEVIPLHYFDKPGAGGMLCFPKEGIALGEYDTNRTKVFDNDGDAEVGLTIAIVALGRVKNPRIYNSKAEFIGVELEMDQGDQVIITTGKGNKTVTLNGQNRISALMQDSTWLQMPTGEEELTIDSDDGTEGNMYFTVTFRRRYA